MFGSQINGASRRCFFGGIAAACRAVGNQNRAFKMAFEMRTLSLSRLKHLSHAPPFCAYINLLLSSCNGVGTIQRVEREIASSVCELSDCN